MKTAIILALSAAAASYADEADWISLFNGQNLEGWNVAVEEAPIGSDPKGHIVVRDGNIHMYADTPQDLRGDFGVIVTDGTHSRFHLDFEYAWGPKKFDPRKDKPRDTGLLYHIADRIALQLEGAEILYRNIRIRKLAPPLAPAQRYIADSKEKPDAHQRLLPPWKNGDTTAQFDPGTEPFSLVAETRHGAIPLDPSHTKTKLAHQTRVFPVHSVFGAPVRDTVLVCFEDASNGNYQDALFLIENLRPFKD